LNKLIMGIDLSREAIEDCGSLAASIAPLMTLNLALTVDEAILRGDGQSKPLGILNAPATLPVSRVGALAVTYPDLVAMLGKLHPNCRNAIWIVSPTVLPQLLGMVDGANHYIWQPSAVGSAAGAVPTSLLGRPLFISDMASALGTTGDVILADFGFYGFVQKQGMIVEQTNAARWTEDAVSMRCVWRLDGSPLLTTPITSRNSGGTLSPFVILD
jgi:HK97 family phage major capsid protein